jgi:two-component system, OmpR family, sensor histidine kinase BaeS
MFKTLRNRLIFSHILPLLIIMPIMGIALVLVLENWIYLPNLSSELEGDARFISRIAADTPDLWNHTEFAQSLLQGSSPRANARIMLLSGEGTLVASSNPEDAPELGKPINVPELQEVRNGQTVRKVHYNQWLNADTIDILVPVISKNNDYLGAVRLTYHYATVTEEFFRLRYLIAGLMIFGLLLGSLLGYLLATSIEAPVQDVTGAVDELAHGSRTQLLKVYGPEELQRLALAVNDLVTRLREMEKARKQLLANLVHELGRPLGALRSAIQALANGAEKDPAMYQELIAGMDAETVRLESLVKDLALLYEQFLGTLELDLQEINLSEWLPTVLRTWQEAALEKRIRWQIELSNSLPDVQADPIRLAQVVGNLVSNAIKFTPANGQVTISTCLVEGNVGIAVKDTGPGISPEEQQEIFKPFYRGTQGRRFPQGMGLGLSITRDLVQAHGGRLEVSSIPGSGSSFTIWLPVHS